MSEDMAVYEAKLLDPKAEIEYGHRAATALVAIVKQAGLSRRFGGEKDHLFYEAWQALGKFYGYTIKTGWAEPVEFDGIKGFKARAEITDDAGMVIGGAEAYCMRDEANWKSKPFFQLASMAQTRAGSKAMRNKLAFVVSLAGFEPTPAEEMDGVCEAKTPAPKPEPPKPQPPKDVPGMLTIDAAGKLRDMMIQMGHEKKNILQLLSLRVKRELKKLTDLKEEEGRVIVVELETEFANNAKEKEDADAT